MNHDPLEQAVQAVEKARQEVPQSTRQKRRGVPLKRVVTAFGVLMIVAIVAVVVVFLAPRAIQSARRPHPGAPVTRPTSQRVTVSAATTLTVTPTAAPTSKLATPTSGALSHRTPTPPKKPSPTTRRIVTPTPRTLLGLIAAERGVNVRAQPDTEAERVGGLPKGTRVALLARNHDCTWLYVRGKVENVTMEGWVFARFVQVPENACSVLQEKQP